MPSHDDIFLLSFMNYFHEVWRGSPYTIPMRGPRKSLNDLRGAYETLWELGGSFGSLQTLKCENQGMGIYKGWTGGGGKCL